MGIAIYGAVLHFLCEACTGRPMKKNVQKQGEIKGWINRSMELLI